MHADASYLFAFVGGVLSFLSPVCTAACTGLISMLSGVGVDQLRQEKPPRSKLFLSALTFVAVFRLCLFRLAHPLALSAPS